LPLPYSVAFGAEKLRRLADTASDVPRGIARGTPRLEPEWAIANAKFTSHGGHLRRRSERTGDLIHSDVCGPFNHVIGRGNAKYFAVFVDAHSDYTFSYPIRDTSTDELKRATLAFVDSFRGFAATVTHTDIGADALHAALCDISVKTLHSDQGSNYMSAEFEAFLQSKNISHTTSPAYAKAINGVAERRIGMVTDIARYYMLLSGAPPSFWSYTVTHTSTALNLSNLVVTHGKSKKPPLEVITGCRQRVMNHLSFGCAAVVTKQVRERDNELVARGVAGTFVGRSPDVIGSYLIWVPAHGKIVATADVCFDDKSFPWVSGSNRHPPSILAANRLRLAAAHALRGKPEPAPQAPQWASSSNAAPTPPPARRPVLHLFSGHPHPEDFASHLKLHVFHCHCVGLNLATGINPNITDDAVLSSLLHSITDHEFSAVVMNPPSEAYSIVRHLNDGPSRLAALYTIAYPDGVPTGTRSPRRMRSRSPNPNRSFRALRPSSTCATRPGSRTSLAGPRHATTPPLWTEPSSTTLVGQPRTAPSGPPPISSTSCATPVTLSRRWLSLNANSVRLCNGILVSYSPHLSRSLCGS